MYSYDRRKTARADSGATAELQHVDKMLGEVFKKCQAVKEPVQQLETFEVFEKFLQKHLTEGETMLVKVKRAMDDISVELKEREERVDYSEKWASR